MFGKPPVPLVVPLKGCAVSVVVESLVCPVGNDGGGGSVSPDGKLKLAKSRLAPEKPPTMLLSPAAGVTLVVDGLIHPTLTPTKPPMTLPDPVTVTEACPFAWDSIIDPMLMPTNPPTYLSSAPMTAAA